MGFYARLSAPANLRGFLLPGLFAAFLLGAFFLGVAPVSGQVAEVYAALEPERLGRAADRSRIERFTRSDFLNAPYAELPDDHPGFLTAVHISRQNRCTLEALVQWRNPLEWCALTLEAAGDGPSRRFRLSSEEDALAAVFSVERPGQAVLSEVRGTYRALKQPEWEEKVSRHYRENYVLRIWGGEDFNKNGRLDYREAMAMASLLGDAEQWLWGVRDGADYMAPLRECEPALHAGVLPCTPSGSSSSGSSSSGSSPGGSEPPEEAGSGENGAGSGENGAGSGENGAGIRLVPGQMGEGQEFEPLEESGP